MIVCCVWKHNVGALHKAIQVGLIMVHDCVLKRNKCPWKDTGKPRAVMEPASGICEAAADAMYCSHTKGEGEACSLQPPSRADACSRGKLRAGSRQLQVASARARLTTLQDSAGRAKEPDISSCGWPASRKQVVGQWMLRSAALLRLPQPV